ncbi:MAG TPA: FeoA family protein, partial [Candidatus Omnitrophota bacterium]|nr:FeoA family protein [Candidatus Omnitrophota bacterium]
MPFDHGHKASHPLTQAKPGQRVRVVAFAAGEGLERRMTELGIARGAVVEMVGRMGRKGAVIVAAHG